MDKSEIINIVSEFALRVRNKYDTAEVILFGSYAKGTNHKDSDIDIAVVLKDFDSSANIQLELMRIRRKIDSRIEPHPFRLEDFNTTNPLANEIIQFGQIIES
ncbi:MAG: nucleotidyltransferase domain-containing protein [Melioribacteraceae bacterium]|nr:nucleotidyltransferase domain-containing protein [Melioribacteraceae bacterium]